MGTNTIISILISLLTISSTIFIVIIQRQTERIKIIENQLSQNKLEAYSNLFGIFFNILKNKKLKKENKNLVSELLDLKKSIFTYGSDKVIKSYIQWLSYISSNNEDINVNLKLLFNLFIEIRKDMGYKKTELTLKDFLRLLMQNEIEVMKFEKEMQEKSIL